MKRGGKKNRKLILLVWVILLLLVLGLLIFIGSRQLIGRVIETDEEFVRGDLDGNKRLTIGDTISIINYLFVGGKLECEAVADVNSDGKIDIGDAIYLQNYLFMGGDAPLPLFADECRREQAELKLDQLVVWSEREYGNYDIFGCILREDGTGCDTYDDKLRFTYSENEQYNPAYSDGILVWQEAENGYSNIQRCNLDEIDSAEECEKRKIVVTSDGLQNIQPSTNGKYLVWKNDEGVLACYLGLGKGMKYSCFSKSEKILVKEGHEITDPVIKGNYIFWKEAGKLWACKSDQIYDCEFSDYRKEIDDSVDIDFLPDSSDSIVVYDKGEKNGKRILYKKIYYRNPTTIARDIGLSSGPEIFKFGNKHYVVYKDTSFGVNAIYVYVIETRERYKVRQDVYSGGHYKTLFDDGKLLFKNLDNFENRVLSCDLKEMEGSPCFERVYSSSILARRP